MQRLWTGLFLVPVLMAGAALPSLGQQTPEQRMELIQRKIEEGKKMISAEPSPAEEARFIPYKGVVVDEAGKPVAEADINIKDSHYLQNVKYQSTEQDGTFSGKVWPGRVEVTVTSPNFAPLSKTFDEGFDKGKVRLVMSRGQDFRIRCVDETGAPAEGVELTLNNQDYSGESPTAKTGKDGWATFQHLTPGWQWDLSASSQMHYGLDQKGIRITGKSLSTPITLQRQPRFRLILKEEGTGTPLSQMKVIFREAQPDEDFSTPNWPDDMKSDEKGEIMLSGLDTKRAFDLVAVNDTHGGAFRITPDSAMTQTVEIPRKVKLRLTIINLPPSERTLSLATSDKTEDVPPTEITNADVKDGKAEFDLMVRRSAMLAFRFLKLKHQIEFPKDDAPPLVLDYEKIKPKDAHVLIRLQPAASVPTTGTLAISWYHTGRGRGDQITAEIKNGQAEFDAPKGATFTVVARKMIGARLSQDVEDGDSGSASRSKQLKIEDDTTTVVLRVVPAGIIRAVALESDGTRARKSIIQARNLSLPSGDDRIRIQESDDSNDKVPTFHVSPGVEFGTDTYYAYAICGLRSVIGTRFQINAANPVQDVVLKLPPSQTRTIRVVDELGKPAPDLMMDITAEDSILGSLQISSQKTDGQGRLRLEMNPVTATAPDTVTLLLSPSDVSFVPAKSTVKFNAAGEAKVVVQRGKRLFGRIVNKSTKKNAQNEVSLCWQYPEYEVEGENAQEPPSVTSEYISPDRDGRFEFTNVPSRNVQLMLSLPEGVQQKFPNGSKEEFFVAPTPNAKDAKEIVIELQDEVQVPQQVEG